MVCKCFGKVQKKCIQHIILPEVYLSHLNINIALWLCNTEVFSLGRLECSTQVTTIDIINDLTTAIGIRHKNVIGDTPCKQLNYTKEERVYVQMRTQVY